MKLADPKHEPPSSRVISTPWLAGLGAAAVAFGAFMFLEPDGIRSGDAYRDNDWLSILFFARYLHTSVHEFGQFPLWCPFVGGGYPTVQHPSDGSLTPFAIPVLLLGDCYGVKVNLILLLFAGGLGVFGIARQHLGCGEAGAGFSALAYMAAGWFPSTMLVGYYNLAMFHLAPGILFFLLRSFTRWRAVLPAGLLYGLSVFQGSMGVVTTGLFAGVLTLGSCVRRPAGRWSLTARPLASLAVVLAIAVGVGAVRFVGLHDLTGRGTYSHAEERAAAGYNPDRLGQEKDHFYTGVGHFLAAAVTNVPRTATYDPAGMPVEDEYAHLGIPWLALLLFPVSAVLLGRRFAPWLAAGAVFLTLSFGPNSPLDLYGCLIWPLPPLRSISQFYKYTNYFVLLVVALGSGAAVGRLIAGRGRDRWQRWLGLALFVGLLPFAVSSGTLFAQLFRHELPELQRHEQFHQVGVSRIPADQTMRNAYRERARHPSLVEYYNLARNLGTIPWYADIYLDENAVPAVVVDPETGAERRRDDYRGEAWIEGEGSVRRWTLRANTIEVEVDARPGDRLVINQNHHEGWRSDRGPVITHEGLLGVDLDERFSGDVRLRFRPRALMVWMGVSMVVTLLTGLGWTAWVVRDRRLSAGKEG